MTVAALYQCLLGFLYRLRRNNQRWRTYAPGIIEENVWRAQRYGTNGSLVDFGKGTLVPFADLLEEIIELIGKEAVEFDVVDEVRHARTIVSQGTSAQRQINAYEKALADGAEASEALEAVVDELIADTLHGIEV
jgi:carboxylate-amine ligase